MSITRFFRSLSPFIAILGAEKPRLVISLPLFYYDAQLTGVAIANAAFVLMIVACPCFYDFCSALMRRTRGEFYLHARRFGSR